ncbi:hypothetical protein SCNU_12202 [Gordonia neofelifaecis NRRL B-59395]|uniref:Uncharacterized protein n=1 Tax=Gordonia neofelifaecis NRRL B-59395 TaxID=644548 RepID=F1YKK7_9ACTN|nr:hypothetical protein SCNU_12202 [Gordonia neofelifaecis NRRL B-59395]
MSELVSIGWLPLPYTWKRLEFQPDEVRSELQRASSEHWNSAAVSRERK